MGLVRNFYGRNICFYYYGEDHLVVNLYKYIKMNLEKNNYVYLYLSDEIYKMLMRNLTDNEKDMVQAVSIDNIILRKNKADSSNSNVIKKLKDDALKMGFWNITIIVDAARMIKSLHQYLFEDFLCNLSSECAENKLNILTCYDFVDYTDREKNITDKIMKMSYKFHNYRMFSNEIVPIENFVLHSEEDVADTVMPLN